MRGGLAGVWKLSTTARGVPRRVRFLDDASVAVPYSASSSGAWRVSDAGAGTDGAGAGGAREVDFSIEWDEGAAGAETSARARLSFSGLFDGERIAGSVHRVGLPEGGSGGAAPASAKLGEFLATRLFSFWGTPEPRATEPPARHGAAPAPGCATRAEPPPD